MVKILLKVKNAMSSGKEKDGKKGGGLEVAGFQLSVGMIKNVYSMAKGFTVKRIFSMLGGKFTKEQILEINSMLNKVKKPNKK